MIVRIVAGLCGKRLRHHRERGRGEMKWQGQVRRLTDALETLGRDKLRARERLTFLIIRTDQGKEKWQALRAMASSVGTEDG